MHINMFLASSIIEFEDFRCEIGAFVRRIQDQLIDDGIRVHLFVCEYCDSSVSARGRKQDDYMEELKKSDIFLMLIGKKLGRYTEEEYDKACQCSQIVKKIVFLENKNIDNTVVKFQNKVKEDSHTFIYHTSDVDEIKNMILDSVCKKLDGIQLVYDNGKIKKGRK